MDEQMDHSLVAGSGNTRGYSRVIIMVYHSCLFLTNNQPPFCNYNSEQYHYGLGAGASLGKDPWVD